jgi:hypothetical protein
VLDPTTQNQIVALEVKAVPLIVPEKFTRLCGVPKLNPVTVGTTPFMVAEQLPLPTVPKESLTDMLPVYVPTVCGITNKLDED